MHLLPILPCHPSVSHLIVGVCATVYRLEFQYGFGVPVSQLEGVCGRLRPALRVRRGGTYLHARKSQVLPWGNDIFPNYYSSRNIHTGTVLTSLCITMPPHGFILNMSRIICHNMSNWECFAAGTFPSRCLIRPNSVSHPKLLEEALYVPAK